MIALNYFDRKRILCAFQMDNWCRRKQLLLLRVEVDPLNGDRELSTFYNINLFSVILPKYFTQQSKVPINCFELITYRLTFS